MTDLVALLFSAVALAGIYAIMAVGLVLLSKATNVVNFAHGDLMTAGAYIAVWLTGTLSMPVLGASALTVLILFLAGIVLALVTYAPLRNAPPITMVLGTLGVALVIRSALGIWQGTAPKKLEGPVGDGSITVLGAAVEVQRILVIGVAAAAIILVALVFTRTRLGRQLRAMAADRTAAQLLGVRVDVVAVLAFGTSAALAGLAGVLIAPLVAVTLNLGFSILISAFAVAVLAGFGSVTGIVVAALLVGLVQQVVGNYIFQDYSDILPFVLMILIIAVRPQGLFVGHSRTRIG